MQTYTPDDLIYRAIFSCDQYRLLHTGAIPICHESGSRDCTFMLLAKQQGGGREKIMGQVT
jgi:hypothetical protein